MTNSQRAQLMSDRVRGTHGNATPHCIHRFDDAHLALEPWIQITGIALCLQQAWNENLQSFSRRSIATLIRLQRAQGLDTVIHSTDTGGKPDAFRGRGSEARVQDDQARISDWRGEEAFLVRLVVGAAGYALILPAGERGGDCYDPDIWLVEIFAETRGGRPHGLQVCLRGDVVREGPGDDFGAVCDAAGAEGDDAVHIQWSSVIDDFYDFGPECMWRLHVL